VDGAVEDGHRLAAETAQVAGAGPDDVAAVPAGILGFLGRPGNREGNKRMIRIRTRPGAHTDRHNARLREHQPVRPALDALVVKERPAMSANR
jgi:hypothetical protein